MFLSLPGEIRNQIYEYAIGGNTAFTRYSGFYMHPPGPFLTLVGFRAPPSSKTWCSLFNLKSVCRQLRAETRLLPYKLNTFNCSHESEFDVILDSLEDEKGNVITTISFGKTYKGYGQTHYIVFRVSKEIKQCKGLKSIISISTIGPNKKKRFTAVAKQLGVEPVIVANDYFDYFFDNFEDSDGDEFYD